MSFAGSGYIAFLKRERIRQEKEKKKKEREKVASKDREKFLRKFGLM